jgi:hypothetical protein
MNITELLSHARYDYLYLDAIIDISMRLLYSWGALHFILLVPDALGIRYVYVYLQPIRKTMYKYTAWWAVCCVGLISFKGYLILFNILTSLWK